MSSPHIDETLKQWATPRQSEFIDAINEYGSARAAAKALGLSKTTITDAMVRLRKKAAVQGYSPEHGLTHVIPEPFVARGHSTLRRNGKVLLQWEKTRLDDQKYQEMIQGAVAALSEDLPRLPPSIGPRLLEQARDLTNLYVLTDVHIGAHAWHREGGANWDLKIAERTVTQSVMKMMEISPVAETAIVCVLGDWFHSDGLVPVTPTSGHVLDQDGRFSKMVEVGVRLCRRVVDEALRRHSNVILLLAEGNHDMASSVWMQTMFSALYELETRIEVIKTHKPYYAIQQGRTALFFHHGHKTKLEALPLLFAAEFPQIWGNALKRYAHTGHYHSLKVTGVSGIRMTQHATLSARDAHASRSGYFSERMASSITYHREFGMLSEHIVTPEMLSLQA